MKVFVYGTLKRGYGNNILLAGSQFLEERVLPGYKLYNAGFPVAAPDENSSIKGEVFDIAEEDVNRTLYHLDRLEGEGWMYNRMVVDDVSLYVGHPKAWSFDRMSECHNVDGVYEWARNTNY